MLVFESISQWHINDNTHIPENLTLHNKIRLQLKDSNHTHDLPKLHMQTKLCVKKSNILPN